MPFYIYIDIKNGIAQNIQIYSQGKSMNLYIGGALDLTSAYAKMEVWGKPYSQIDKTGKQGKSEYRCLRK